MADRAQIERIILDVYEARRAGDLDAIGRAFTSNARFRVVGASDASPAPLKAEGVKNLQVAVKEMMTVFQWLDQEILTFLVDGQQAAVHWRGTIRSSATGETVRTELMDLFEIDGERISSLTEFCDTALAARLMGVSSH